jgi:hypothetical protein
MIELGIFRTACVLARLMSAKTRTVQKSMT